MAIHSVDQAENSSDTIVGVSCRNRTEGLEQSLAFCRCQPVCICHHVPLHILKATQQPGSPTATCASEWLYCTNTPPSLYWLKTYSLQDADYGSPAYCMVRKLFIHKCVEKTL